MKPRRDWAESTVRLYGAATVTTFNGPGDDFLLVIHGKRVLPMKRPRKNGKARGA